MDNALGAFLAASFESRLRLVLDSNLKQELKAYIGDKAFVEYELLAHRARRIIDLKHLGTKTPKNLIFVPGAMGSLLTSPAHGGVWWIDFPRMARHLNGLQLSPDGTTDMNPSLQIIPFNIDITYESFQLAVLERDDFNHDVYPYDWRKPLVISATGLRDKIVRLFEENGNKPIHLVGHSMGGLIIRTLIMLHGEELWPKIGNIVFIGTPHYGSAMIASYLKNHLWGFDLMGALAFFISRETFRSLWGALSLLPAPVGIYPGTKTDDRDYEAHPCANFNLYEARNWQLDLSPEKEADLQRVLDGAKMFYQQIDKSHQKLTQRLRDRMAVIAGVGYQTFFRLAYRPGLLGLWENMDKIKDRVHGNPHREGDGSVPLASALLQNAGEVRYVKGIHRDLPALPQVYTDVFRWLNSEPMQLPNTPAQALTQHLGFHTDTNEYPHITRQAAEYSNADDPGYLNFGQPSYQFMEQFKSQVDAGQIPHIPEVNSIRLL